ncbi:MAG: hypothetical protein PVH73_09055 [Candidatus Bathyarchaeota archaeon]
MTSNKGSDKKDMTKDLRCPFGIPDSECCKASTCPTWVARRKRNNQ